MLSNPPPEVSALCTMLVASQTWANLAGSAKTSSVHYPSMSTGDSVNPEAAPALLIEPSSDTISVVAPGIALPDGSLTVILLQKEVDAAAIETTARAIAYDIAVMPIGLPITGTKIGMCSNPDAASRAAQDASDDKTLGLIIATRTIPIIISYKLG